MSALGIETGTDLRAQMLPFLLQHFGKAGTFYYWISRGIDNRTVQAKRECKSIGAENTFMMGILTLDSAGAALQPIIEKSGAIARTVPRADER
jgi:DNA polymerase IV